jgi:hypothetical protein
LHFVHEKEQEERLREHEERENEQKKARRGVIVKYFAEKISPTVHDGSLIEGGFSTWKQMFVHEIRSVQSEKEAKQLREALENEKLFHQKTRQDMMIQ